MKDKKFLVGCSSLTSTLYAGTVTKGVWGKDRKDVTDSAPLAVAQHLMQLNESVVFDFKGKKYILKVEEYHDTTETVK